MAKWGKFDFSEFEKLAKTFKKAVDERVFERFIEEFLLEMAMRSLRRIKKRTPVDTGHLRRNWKVGKVVKQGDAYIIEIYNNTEYGTFVEYGHRTGEGLTKWVEGRFMMTISMQEIERELPKYLERRQRQLLRKLMGGK